MKLRHFALASTAAVLAAHAPAQQTDTLAAAQYTADGRLDWPGDTDRWIHLGTTLGGEYEGVPFDPANPGVFGVVQMEPSAYDYLLEHGRYADGTMLLLSFYPAADASEPPLQGFTQTEVGVREIHVIDRSRFAAEGRAFFVFAPGSQAPAAAIPPGSECVTCHTEHGAFDATFTQFYPAVRERVVAAD